MRLKIEEENEVNKLINCKACGKEIAKGVKKCLYCGKDQRNFFMKHKIITFIFAFIIITGIGSALDKDNDSPSTTVDTKVTEVKKEKVKEEKKVEVIKVSANEFLQAYEDNEVKADKTYKNKTVLLTGEITEIGVSFGSTYVILSSGEGYSFTGARCFFEDDSEIDKVAELKDGDTVTIQGIVDAKSIYIGVKDCVLK